MRRAAPFGHPAGGRICPSKSYYRGGTYVSGAIRAARRGFDGACGCARHAAARQRAAREQLRTAPGKERLHLRQRPVGRKLRPRHHPSQARIEPRPRAPAESSRRGGEDTPSHLRPGRRDAPDPNLRQGREQSLRLGAVPLSRTSAPNRPLFSPHRSPKLTSQARYASQRADNAAISARRPDARTQSTSRRECSAERSNAMAQQTEPSATATKITLSHGW
jgi:hypothetical protein